MSGRLTYYVRVLAKHSNNHYEVQWIDGSTGIIKDVHKHMIDEFQQWQRDNPKRKRRSKMKQTKRNNELKYEQDFIAKTTIICEKDKTQRFVDNAFAPRRTGLFVWCDICDSWYFQSCFIIEVDNVHEHVESEYLPCKHKFIDVKLEKEKDNDHDFKVETYLTSFKKNVALTQKDFDILTKNGWINDEIVNYYFAMIAEQCAKKNLKVQVFSSFFLVKFIRDYDYYPVRNWTKKAGFKLEEMDKILVPVHVDGNHWSLAIINIAKRRLEYYDSMHRKNNVVLDKLEKFINDEIKHHKGPNSLLSMKENRWERYIPDHIPLQLNGNDCGIFMLMYAKYAANNKPFTFSQKDVTKARLKMEEEILSDTLHEI